MDRKVGVYDALATPKETKEMITNFGDTNTMVALAKLPVQVTTNLVQFMSSQNYNKLKGAEKGGEMKSATIYLENLQNSATIATNKGGPTIVHVQLKAFAIVTASKHPEANKARKGQKRIKIKQARKAPKKRREVSSDVEEANTFDRVQGLLIKGGKNQITRRMCKLVDWLLQTITPSRRRNMTKPKAKSKPKELRNKGNMKKPKSKSKVNELRNKRNMIELKTKSRETKVREKISKSTIIINLTKCRTIKVRNRRRT